jgi:hypothetical protein
VPAVGDGSAAGRCGGAGVIGGDGRWLANPPPIALCEPPRFISRHRPPFLDDEPDDELARNGENAGADGCHEFLVTLEREDPYAEFGPVNTSSLGNSVTMGFELPACAENAVAFPATSSVRALSIFASGSPVLQSTQSPTGIQLFRIAAADATETETQTTPIAQGPILSLWITSEYLDAANAEALPRRCNQMSLETRDFTRNAAGAHMDVLWSQGKAMEVIGVFFPSLLNN